MPSLREDIIQLLHEAQGNTLSHQRLLKSLRGWHDKHRDDLNVFFETFFRAFSNVLVVFKREPAAQRVIELTAKFAVSTAPPDCEDSDGDEEEVEVTFFSLLLEHLVSLHNAQDKGVRFRVCQLVARLLSLARETGCIVGTRLVDKVINTMRERLMDKVPVVRVQAVTALEWLQSPEQDCLVTPLFLTLLATDPSPEVRRSVLNKLALSDRSLVVLIERTRDVKEFIRRDAFLRLAECSVRNFKIQQRIQLLSDGLHDDSEMVQEACVNGLLRKWSMDSNNGDFISLLARLDVESSSEIASLALCKLFDQFSPKLLATSMAEMMVSSHRAPEDHKHTPTAAPIKVSNSHSLDVTPTPDTCSLKVIAQSELRCEEVFYWSQLCHYLHTKGMEHLMETILPTASEFCDYVQRYVEEVLLTQEDTEASLKSEFVTEQLLAMMAVLDHTDEVGRCRLAELVTHFLSIPSFPTSLIRHLLSQQTRIWPQESHRVEVLTEVIAELRAAFNVSNDTLNLTSTLLSQSEPRDDHQTLLRCLTISCEMLRELKPQPLSTILRMLKDTLLIPCVQHVDPYVRDMALFSLGLLSLLHISTAREHLLLFVQVSQVDHETVQATALKIVLDLLHVYGFEAFNIANKESSNEKAVETKSEECESSEGGEGSEGGEVCEGSEAGDADRNDSESSNKANATMQRLLNIMINFLEGESSLLSQVSAEGIAKLLLSRRVLSQKLLAKLLVLWYNPVLVEEGHLRAVLGAFFPLFAASDRSCRECLSEVYLPVLTSVLEAPPTSPLYEIDVANMADLIIHLTKPTQSNEESVHDNLAYAVCNAILSDPTSSDVRVYTRSLSQMTLTATNQPSMEGLLALCEQMRTEVVDKIALKYISKFQDMLTPPVDVVPGKSSSKEQSEGTPGQVPATPIPEKPPRGVVKPKAKTTVKKCHPSGLSKAATTGKKRRAGKRKKAVKIEESLSEDSESENLEPVLETTAPVRVPFSRASKSVAAVKLMGDSKAVVSEDSEDSLVGEHSPFVRHTAVYTERRRRLSSGPLKDVQQGLLFDDEV